MKNSVMVSVRVPRVEHEALKLAADANRRSVSAEVLFRCFPNGSPANGAPADPQQAAKETVTP